MKKTLLLLCLAALASCDRPFTAPETKTVHAGGDMAINMRYTMTKTSYREISTDLKAESSPEINRSIPVVSKEKIDLKILHDGSGEINIESLPVEEEFFTTLATDAADGPAQAKYFKIGAGKYAVYDAAHKLIFEQPANAFNFTALLDQVKRNVADISSLPAMVTGGVVFYPMEKMTTGSNTDNTPRAKSTEDPLHNSYDDNDAYQVVRETYVDQTDGRTYTQETIIKKSNNTLAWVSLYNDVYSLVSRTSFKYEGPDEKPQLVSTQDDHYERTEDGLVHQIEITEYENFEIALNL